MKRPYSVGDELFKVLTRGREGERRHGVRETCVFSKILVITENRLVFTGGPHRFDNAAFIISSTSCAGLVSKCLYKTVISFSRSSLCC